MLLSIAHRLIHYLLISLCIYDKISTSFTETCGDQSLEKKLFYNTYYARQLISQISSTEQGSS
jgi:hypothetical protein